MTKMEGSGSESGSGSISQRHGSADPDPDPDPPQNIMDPQHSLAVTYSRKISNLCWVNILLTYSILYSGWEGSFIHRVITEWQRPLSGVHSIMMEKISPGWWGWGPGVHAHPLSLYLPSRKKLQFYAQLSPYFVSIPMYSPFLSMKYAKLCTNLAS